MPDSDDLLAIIDRIISHQHSDDDLAVLPLVISTGSNQDNIQIGRHIVNIAEGRDIHIGDKIYQGADAEAIRKMICSLFQEFQTSFSQEQNQYPELKLSLERKMFAEYYKRSGELISESYLRNDKPVIDKRCAENLKRAEKLYKLSPEHIKEINEEILTICENYGNPFTEQIQELKLIIEKYGASSNQVDEWLEDCPKFIQDSRFVGTVCSLSAINYIYKMLLKQLLISHKI